MEDDISISAKYTQEGLWAKEIQAYSVTVQCQNKRITDKQVRFIMYPDKDQLPSTP
uniref:Uncharacterized protein n=1 Tax=Rhizophora mucronata TaxID=61149 RepID=A0A2P2NNS7_RHIMU